MTLTKHHTEELAALLEEMSVIADRVVRGQIDNEDFLADAQEIVDLAERS